MNDNVESSIDATLAEIRRLSALIADSEPGPVRSALEQEREAVRAAAALMSDTTKSVDQLKAELTNVEGRLEALSEVTIKPAWVEGHKWLNDPSAYRRRINESIEDNDAAERDQLEQRRTELLDALANIRQSE